jgi:hypothetical protein
VVAVALSSAISSLPPSISAPLQILIDSDPSPDEFYASLPSSVPEAISLPLSALHFLPSFPRGYIPVPHLHKLALFSAGLTLVR